MKSEQLDVAAIRADFPILSRRIHGRPLVYLDNAASTQKPRQVIEAITQFYEQHYANVHRGLYKLSEDATRLYEDVRADTARFINADTPDEIVFVRGATEAINLVAQTFGRKNLNPGDEVLVTGMEHHSNIVPWQMVCGEQGAKVRVAPITQEGEVDLEAFEKSLNNSTRLISIIHVSNVLGTINPVKTMVQMAAARGIPSLVDGAQAAPHMRIDVQDIGCDFYTISSHKMYGPTGIGVLYGKRRLLEEMPPYQGGGDMILSVSFEGTKYNRVPYKFEAGTPNIAGTIGFGAAMRYLENIGYDYIQSHEWELMEYVLRKLAEIPEVRIVGNPRERGAAISFTVQGAHPHDVSTILDNYGVAIRAGHHCAQPLVEFFGLPATARASFGLYNTTEEVDALTDALKEVARLFA